MNFFNSVIIFLLFNIILQSACDPEPDEQPFISCQPNFIGIKIVNSSGNDLLDPDNKLSEYSFEELSIYYYHNNDLIIELDKSLEYDGSNYLAIFSIQPVKQIDEPSSFFIDWSINVDILKVTFKKSDKCYYIDTIHLNNASIDPGGLDPIIIEITK